MRVCKVRLRGLDLVPESRHSIDGDDANCRPSGRGSEKGCSWEANETADLDGVYFLSCKCANAYPHPLTGYLDDNDHRR